MVGRGKHCPEQKRELIKKNGKTYKEINETFGNILKYKKRLQYTKINHSTGSYTLKVCPRISNVRKKSGETYCGPTKAKLFYLVGLGLDNMLDVRPKPNIKLNIHKR